MCLIKCGAAFRFWIALIVFKKLITKIYFLTIARTLNIYELPLMAPVLFSKKFYNYGRLLGNYYWQIKSFDSF